MTFDVKAKGDVQIGFFEAVPTMSKMYDFLFGCGYEQESSDVDEPDSDPGFKWFYIIGNLLLAHQPSYALAYLRFRPLPLLLLLARTTPSVISYFKLLKNCTLWLGKDLCGAFND